MTQSRAFANANPYVPLDFNTSDRQNEQCWSQGTLYKCTRILADLYRFAFVEGNSASPEFVKEINVPPFFFVLRDYDNEKKILRITNILNVFEQRTQLSSSTVKYKSLT